MAFIQNNVINNNERYYLREIFDALDTNFDG